MNVGFVGLGKLGLPCALVIEQRGHEVIGYDPSLVVNEIIASKEIIYKEIWAQSALERSKIECTVLEDVVKHSEIIFVAVQTPHEEKYEGITRVPEERVDFDYSYLRGAVKNLSEAIEANGEDKVVIIISTVLPGTIEREIRPLLCDKVKLCYNPFFIAMGTTMRDFINPEFVLFGVDDKWAADKAEAFYKTIHNAPFFRTDIKTAELVKVAYNTFISMKICYINTMMEICHKTGANVDDLSRALYLGTDRIISTKYLRGGMGDGGGCHPRDNIALSWLAKKLDLSYDFFGGLMECREKQTDWLADLVEKEAKESGLPIMILGRCFKKETNLTVGSPAVLLINLLKERGIECDSYEPYIDKHKFFMTTSVFFIGSNHDCWSMRAFPKGSVVIDPWGIIEDQTDVKVIRVGR